ncbi:DUF4878 domain-containing protein [Paenibacillus nanensis]|uniref:DUF4878 domain-containing protein n=1 Tax=Paenibacillus nanensis TaxID=393251 RepID=A0A3A1UPI0_9BACL|nr:DUF4878 domain-containing protein [Paenibacillus nanensis]RIX49247.1 DUF4878 domain-containing protein [Paenibacillus nanensis]
MVDGLKGTLHPLSKPKIINVEVTEQTDEKATMLVTVDMAVGGENKEEIVLVKEQNEWRIVAPKHWFKPE